MNKRLLIYTSTCFLILGLIGFRVVSLNQENNLKLDIAQISENMIIENVPKIEFEKQVVAKTSDESTEEEFIREHSVEDTKKSYAKFITEETGLSMEGAKFLISQCEEKDLNLFLMLGLMKLESGYDRYLVGTSGERGLGQIMIETGRSLAKNLDKEFHPDYLFEPKYNIELFTTFFSYLDRYYDGDLHKVLTAYNRGQGGLKKYMASRGQNPNPALSTYSKRVIEYTNNIIEEYAEKYEQ